MAVGPAGCPSGGLLQALRVVTAWGRLGRASGPRSEPLLPPVPGLPQGVMVGTERAIKAAAAEGLPICLLISKVDR